MTDVMAALALVLSACSLVLLVILLLRQNTISHQQEEENLRREHDLDNWGNDLLNELDDEHDRNTAALNQVNQNLMSTLSQMGQSQTTLLESMQRQVLLSTRNQEESAGRVSTEMNDVLTRLEKRMENLRDSTEASLSSIRKENDRQLAEIRSMVEEKLSADLETKLNASFSQVSERLESVYKGLGEMQSLAAGVGDLKKVFSNVKTRGIWGEMQLGNLIRQGLAPGQYEENIAVVPGSSERVEFAIRIPDKTGATVWLAIDSKFPQESYLRLVDASKAGDVPAAEEARKSLIKALRAEAKKISDKYVSPPHTADFAVMFLPIEGLYAEVLQSPELIESLQRDLRVVPAGPGTFSALLSALQMGFRTLAIEKRSGEVWKLLGEIKTDFVRFAALLEETQKRLNQAGETIDTAVSRTRTIQRKLTEVETLPGDPEPTYNLN